MSAKSRETILSEVMPRLRAEHADGVVSRPELVAECARVGLSQPPPWLVSTPVANRRGYYDVSAFFEDRPGVASLRAEVAEDTRTDAEVDSHIGEKFDVLDRMATGLAHGTFRALFVSGPPGIGKTWTAEVILEAAKARGMSYEKVSGYARATGLYRKLWENREANQIILIDDCDSVFADEVALNLLKAACDTTQRRTLAWRSETEFEDEMGEEIPRHFEYHGRIVFVTNLDFDAMARSGSRLAPHLAAMMSRSFYLDLNLSHREVLSRVVSVARKTEILGAHTAKEKEKIVSYVRDNAEKMREVSLRALIKLSQILSATKSDADFKRISDATLLRR